MLKVLAISHLFPPVLSPRSIRLGIITRFQQERGEAEWTVLCATPGSVIEPSCPQVGSLLHPGVRTVRTFSLESRYLRWLANKGLPFSLLAVPDPQIGWLPSALAKAAALLKEGDFDVLCSFSSPPTSHLVAGLARRRTGRRLPWLAFLSDPWTRFPLLRQDRLARTLNERLERWVFSSADRLAFTWSHGLDWALEGHPEEFRRKSVILPHCFDPRAYRAVEAPAGFQRRPGRMRLVYAGVFYGTRTPSTLFQSLEIIREKQPETFGDLEILLLAGSSRAVQQEIQERGLGEVVRATERVPYLTSLAVMDTADGLLVIDAAAKASPFFPSKLVDYMGVGCPIFGITARTGPSAEILALLGQASANPAEPAEIASGLTELWSLWRAGRLKERTPDLKAVERFSLAAVSRLYLDNLRELAAGG